MPATVSWFLQDHIIIYRLTGKVTLDELAEAWKQASEYRDSVAAGQVHSLCNVGGTEEVPLTLSAIMHGAKHPLSHPNQGWVVLYNVNDCLISMIVRIVTRSLGVSFHAAESETQALDFLNMVDATLPPLHLLIDRLGDQHQVSD